MIGSPRRGSAAAAAAVAAVIAAAATAAAAAVPVPSEKDDQDDDQPEITVVAPVAEHLRSFLRTCGFSPASEVLCGRHRRA